MKNISKKYVRIIEEDKNKAFLDYEETKKKVASSTAVYMKKPIPFLFHPMFFGKQDINRFKYLSQMMMQILNKIIDKYIESKEYRKKFGYDKLLEELVL